jgi:hypothetical protein
MTPQQLVGIAVRLFALWLAISSTRFLLAIPLSLEANHVESGTGASYFVGGVYLVVALILWFFPMWVAHRLVPHTRFENRLSPTSFDLARVGCSILGIWLLSRALPSVVWFMFRSYLADSSEPLFSSLNAEGKADFAVSVFEVLLSILLIARSGSFARAIVRE